MNRETLDSWCERGILGLLLAILGVGPLALGATRPVPFLVIQGLTVGTMFLWALRLWIAPKPRLLWPPICWAVIAFAAYAVVRCSQCEAEYIARQETIQVIIYAFLFLIVVNNLHRQESVQIITYSLIFLGMVIAGYAIFQYVTDSDKVWNLVKPYKHRGSGTYISPNHLAGFLELLIPLGLTYTLAGRSKALTRVGLGYATLVMMVGIIASLSRGGWAGAAASLLLVFAVLAFNRKYRISALVMLGVVLIGIVVLGPKSQLFERRMKPVELEEQIKEDMRFELWHPAILMWKDNLWCGVGPGQFDNRFGKYRPLHVQRRAQYVHNDYLNLLADWGAVGGLMVAGALVMLGVGVRQTWRRIGGGGSDLGGRQGSNKMAFVWGGAASVTAILVHSMVDFNTHIPANAITLVVIIALMSSHLRFSTERYWSSARFGIKGILSIGLVAGIVFLSIQSWRQGGELAWKEEAIRAENYSIEQAECLTKAFAYQHSNAETAYAIGEVYRNRGLLGAEGYQQDTTKALEWYGAAMKLNPWNSRAFFRAGQCLDWLGRYGESTPYFSRAEELDPNDFFTVANIGLHYVELRDFAAARAWFERSWHLNLWAENTIAIRYKQLMMERMAGAATNGMAAQLLVPETEKKK